MINESFLFTARDVSSEALHRAGPEFGVFRTGTFFPISKWSCEFCHVPTGEVDERRKDKSKIELHCDGEKVVNVLRGKTKPIL
jgi:hypothetical protein